MRKRENKDLTDEKILLSTITEAIFEKKGKAILKIDFKNLDYSICDYFVICHGESTTQVEAIVNSIEKKTKDTLNLKPGHIEGKKNLQWIILDFFSIIIHVFEKNQRDIYRMEELWGDAIITEIKE